MIVFVGIISGDCLRIVKFRLNLKIIFCSNRSLSLESFHILSYYIYNVSIRGFVVFALLYYESASARGLYPSKNKFFDGYKPTPENRRGPQYLPPEAGLVLVYISFSRICSSVCLRRISVREPSRERRSSAICVWEL